MPDLLPAQCEDATETDTITGKKLQSFSNWSPRVSATYDLTGNGKTSVKATWSYFYDTRITLANNLGGLFTQTTLTWGPNQSSGACSTAANSGCWTDANRDGFVQANELIGTPTSSSSQFRTACWCPSATTSIRARSSDGRVRPSSASSTSSSRTSRSASTTSIASTINGTATYTQGYQPGAPGYPLSQIYTGPQTFTDPVTGQTAPYYTICDGCARPSGVGTILMTNPNYQIYHGVDITATKRFSNRWQMQSALTLQANPNYFPDGSATFINPTNRPFQEGISTIEPWIFKLQGSYTLPWDIIASGNLNMYDGATRTLTINGPGQVYGGDDRDHQLQHAGVHGEGRVAFRPDQAARLGVQKVFQFNGGRQRIKLILDGFNVFNVNTITAYVSGNRSLAGFTQPSTIVSPRVFRVGTQLVF